MILYLLLLFARCAVALRFNLLTPKILMLQGQSEQTIGTLFHSIDLDLSLHDLIVLLWNELYPFQTFYESGCKEGIDLARYRELLAIPNLKVRKSLLSAECLRRAQVLISSEDIALIPQSILRTSANLPPNTARGAFIKSVHRMLGKKRIDIKTCRWLFGTHIQSIGKGINNLGTFWMFYHPACYIRELPTDYRSEEPVLMESQQTQTSRYLLKRYTLVEGVTDLPQFFRWICQISMVGIELKRSFPEQIAGLLDIEVTLGALRDEIDGNPIMGILYSFEKEYLTQIKLLLNGVLQVLSAVPETLNAIDAIKPSFKSLLGLILGSVNEAEQGAMGLLNHFKLQLCLVFIEVYNVQGAPEINRVLADLKDSPPKHLWPLDAVQIASYILEGSGVQDTALYEIVLKQAEHHTDLQRYLLTTLHKRYASIFPPYTMPGRLSFLLRAIPSTVRLSFVRELAFSYYQGNTVGRIRSRHQKWYGIREDLPVEVLMMLFFSLNPAMVENGKIRIRDPFWSKFTLKSFGYMCGLSVLYGIRLPIRVDEDQLKLLLGYDLMELHRLRSSGDGSGLFPDAPLLATSDKEEVRRVCFETAAVIMSAFRATVRFSGALLGHEISHLLSHTSYL